MEHNFGHGLAGSTQKGHKLDDTEGHKLDDTSIFAQDGLSPLLET